jgi:polyphosphate kinase
MVVRGICSLIPGIKGMSENIEVVSIVDRFLEHSRIFIFCNNNDEQYYISSADWMTRNLDYRVEVASAIYDPEIRTELKSVVLAALKDNVKARILDAKLSNGFKKVKGKTNYRSQIELHNYYRNKYIKKE